MCGTKYEGQDNIPIGPSFGFEGAGEFSMCTHVTYPFSSAYSRYDGSFLPTPMAKDATSSVKGE